MAAGMSESQNVEWKRRWRDEYLRWICGFANAEGGVLVIGRGDDGAVVGLSGVRKLLEDIPNKVRDVLGIVVDVNLRDGSRQGVPGGCGGPATASGQLQGRVPLSQRQHQTGTEGRGVVPVPPAQAGIALGRGSGAARADGGPVRGGGGPISRRGPAERASGCRAAGRTDAGARRQAAPAGEIAPEARRSCCCSIPTRRSSSRART